MEMDIPLPEELEWLESCANSNYGGHEETLDEAEELLELCRTVPDDDGPEIHSQKRQLERIVGYDGIPGEEQAPKKIKRSGPDGTHNAALEDDASETGIPRPDELEWLESLDGFQEEAEFDDVEADELLELCKANGEAGQGMQKPQQEKGGRNREDPTEKPTGKTSKDPAFDENNDYSSYAEADEDWLLRYIPDKDCHTQETTEMGNSEPESVKEKTISRFASEIDGDFFSVTGSNGDRVYAKLKSQMPVAEGKVSRTGSSGKGLLGEPINVLMDRVEEGAIQTALQQSSVSSPTISESTMAIVNEQLWVDKYAPKFFPELLSDEQTNREVLLWLKQWDPCVYGSRIRATTEDVLSSLRRHSTLMQHHKSSDNKFFNKNSSIFNNMKFKQSTDMENGGKGSREGIESHSKNEKLKSTPEQKVLLLCGPPGLGKTTLAHVAAKHCGYRVVEVNASDDRSASSIESKILDVVQMNSVMADSKPKCLVIDEIDGALGDGKGAIDVILKMVSSDRKANSKDDQMDEKSGKKQSRKGHKSTSLSRPVICICNDLYAPALRPLRQVAKVHLFAQPTINRVVNRLKYICNKEGFKASSIALSALADHTECDIRSCLNTLQFLNKKKEYLNILEIGSQVVGRKDMSKSAFDVWKEVLQKRKDKHDKFNKSNNASRDFERLYSLLSDRGEYELTMDGIYENFLHLSYHDPSFQKTVCCLDALGISDSWHRFVARTHHMHLNGYQPFIAIYIKNLIAQINKPHIEWPKSLQRCRMTLIEKKDQLKCWYNKISPHISRHLSIESFAEELVSPLLNIISPPSLRPVALHLLSEREKEDLHQLVDTMSSYSISYKSSNPQPASETYKYGSASEVEILSLHPPLDSFVNFKDYQSEIHRLSSALKKLLVHEVEMYKIKSEGNSRLSNINGDSIKEIQNTSIKDGSAKSMSYSMNKGRDPTERNLRPFKTNSSPTLNGNSASAVKLKASEITKSPSNPSNFFDRFKKRSKIAQNTGAFHTSATMERDQRPFLFRYNEGYTNAVKRPVKMRELLL